MADELAGVTPAGEPEDDPTVPRVAVTGALVEDIDASSGDLLSLSASVHWVDAHVIHGVRANRGRGPALETAGNNYRDIKKNDTDAEGRVRSETERLFRPLVEAGHVRIDRVAVAAGDEDTATAVIHYTNLRTGKQEQVRA
jgi:hypothetical protein